MNDRVDRWRGAFLADFELHYGISPHFRDALALEFGHQTQDALDELFDQFRPVVKDSSFSLTPQDVESIADETCIRDAWLVLGKPVPLMEFGKWVERVTRPGHGAYEPTLVPLYVWDDILNLAGAAGARGTPYSCEQCRTAARADLLRQAFTPSRPDRRRGQPLRPGSSVWRLEER